MITIYKKYQIFVFIGMAEFALKHSTKTSAVS